MNFSGATKILCNCILVLAAVFPTIDRKALPDHTATMASKSIVTSRFLVFGPALRQTAKQRMGLAKQRPPLLPASQPLDVGSGQNADPALVFLRLFC